MDNIKAQEFLTAEFSEHEEVLKQTKDLTLKPFSKMIEFSISAIKNGNKILFAGNGGSAADAQHWATELTVRYKVNRKAIPAIALTTDTSALTAIGNDFGFDYLFSRQVEALGNKGDVFIAISTSGNSANIINAIEEAKKIGITVIGFTGNGGGKMKNMCDVLIDIPSKTTARIQEMHEILGHSFCDIIEQSI
ncbi:MAG: D-sedoheptulose 7-phosphate isomerase [Proteobacteria bacterium]|nr:D-sedoheptulose 7-phosphate isomerase [Pseudomonadota bacterium]